MLGAAILGTGWSAETHARALTEANIEIWAVVGRDPEKTRHFAEKWNIPNYSTDFALLYAPEIDCVHICTPPSGHGEAIRKLLHHNKHILCEKPLCVDAEEAADLAKIAEEKDLVCALGFHFRFYPACQRAKELVNSPDFGRVLLVHGSYLQEFGAEPAEYSWRYEDPLHAVSEIGSHWLDLAQFISGKQITALSAQFDHLHPQRYQKNGLLFLEADWDREPIEVKNEDAAILSLRFAENIMGAVVLSELSHGRKNALTLEITGEKQSLWWNSEIPDQLTLAQKGKEPETILFPDRSFEAYFKQISTVYKDVEKGRRAENAIYADFNAGENNALLCATAKSSAKDHAAWKEIKI
ncbi:MAG: Gfo/Idh/MocA family oxidoreductase [Oscillospiraceae bacterium]|nr:Gfo/Idh/MocA family oxidoreductase [Oscillospiraceae bacterium]